MAAGRAVSGLQKKSSGSSWPAPLVWKAGGGLMLVALEDARVHGTEHLLGGGRDGAVAEGLERQDGERLLDLDADLVILCA